MEAVDRKRLCIAGVCLGLLAAIAAMGPTWSAAGAAAPPLAEKGICVVLGLPEGAGPSFVAQLAGAGEGLVYFQSPSAQEETAVRKAAQSAGLLGKRVYVDRGSWSQIHLADNLAGTILVAPAAAAAVPEQELLRVLHPQGKAVLGGRQITKPFPAGIDCWSHPFRGPDNNPQSQDRLARMPYLTQFLAEPQFCPMPEVTVAAGGRIFKTFGHIAHKANQNPMLNTLLAINAYNGAILWKRPLREGFIIHRNTMVATPEVLYLADDQSCKLLDAATGELRGEIAIPDGVGDGKVWKWMALADRDGRNPLYALVGGEEIRPKTVPSTAPGLGHWPWSMWEGHEYADPKTNYAFGRTLVAIDPQSRKVLWQHNEEPYVDGRGVCMGNGRIYFYCPGKYLGCLDARAGMVLWKASDAALLEAIGPTGRAQNPREGYATSCYIKCNDKYVFFAGPQRPNLVVVSAADGKLVWQKKGGNLHLVLRDDAFYAVGPGGAKLTYDTWQTLVTLPNRRSCTRATGSLDSVFYRAAEGTMQICTADDRAQHIAPMRPPCQDGVVIAHGMLYWGPWMCGCPLSFYGHVGVTPAGSFEFRPRVDQSRWETGDGDPAKVEPLAVRPGDWPCYQADNQRTSATSVALPEKIARKWGFQAPCTGRPTAPVAVGDMVFVADESGAVRALDAARGTPRWEVFTSGAIFLPPAVWEGRVYVGSADGRVYAFEAATGRRLWSFRAAPAERWIPVLGKLISTWPVAGGVVVEDGVVYGAAGMAHYDGTYVYALDAVTGKLKWHNDSSGQLSEQVNSGISLQGELSLRDGELSFPGGSIYRTARYDLRTGKCLNPPEETVGSRYPTAFYAYYPGYGRYVSLNHQLPDGRRLSYDAAYEGSQHTTLAMLGARKPGDPQPPPLPPWQFSRRIPGKPTARSLWEQKATQRYNSFIVAPNGLLAAGETAGDGPRNCFAALIELNNGSEIWRQDLAAPVVRGGTAVDHAGRILLSLEDGQVLCFGAKK